MGTWTEQLIHADQGVSVENEPLVFINDDKSIAGSFASDIVESWSEVDD
jgi:hypothetical protein